MAAVDTLANFHSCVQLIAVPSSADNPSGEDRLGLDNRSLWPNGSELIVNMWGYVLPSCLFSPANNDISQSDFVRSKVIQYANEWSRYANLTFKFMDRDTPGDSDIRISFTSGAGSWS
jgi:hypothetical protein